MKEDKEKKLVTDDLEIIDFFRVLAKSKERLWLWQQTQKGRTVHFCQVRKLDVLKKTIELSPLTENGFALPSKEMEIFLYSRSKNMAVKFKARELEPHYILMGLPPRLNHLSEELAKKINLVEEENELGMEDKRGQPRKQLGEKQTAQLLRNGQSKVLKFDLYDISAGGLALKSLDPGAFEKGDFIEVFSVNGKELPKRLKGKVVSIRHIVDDDLFKIGVQFQD